VVIETNEIGSARAVAAQPDGSVVVGGQIASCTRVRIESSMLRLTPTGEVDPTFPPLPAAFIEVGPNSVADIAVQGDGRIVAGGFLRPMSGPGSDFALARLNPDGSPDTTFDGDGRVVTDLGGTDFLQALALQADGKLVAAGVSDGDVALARYLAAAPAAAVVGSATSWSPAAPVRPAGRASSTSSPSTTHSSSPMPRG